MAADVQHHRAWPECGWPSIAAASAEIRRPRDERVRRGENPAVLTLVAPAPAASVVDLRARRYAVRGAGR
jgi:hypothetical protein